MPSPALTQDFDAALTAVLGDRQLTEVQRVKLRSIFEAGAAAARRFDARRLLELACELQEQVQYGKYSCEQTSFLQAHAGALRRTASMLEHPDQELRPLKME